MDAKKAYKLEVNERINIYVADAQFVLSNPTISLASLLSLNDRKNEWVLAGSRPKRHIASVVLDANTKERILADAKDFLASENWYAKRGIPWRRGYLLYGTPGSGKTSLSECHISFVQIEAKVIIFTHAAFSTCFSWRTQTRHLHFIAVDAKNRRCNTERLDVTTSVDVHGTH